MTTPLVSIPHTARPTDLRWSVAAMLAGRRRGRRVREAERVLKSRSAHVTRAHKELAREIIAGPGDAIAIKFGRRPGIETTCRHEGCGHVIRLVERMGVRGRYGQSTWEWVHIRPDDPVRDHSPFCVPPQADSRTAEPYADVDEEGEGW